MIVKYKYIAVKKRGVEKKGINKRGEDIV